MYILLTSFNYKNSPSEKLLQAIAPINSNHLRMKRVKKIALQRMNAFFEAASPEQILIFSEKKNIDKITLEQFAIHDGALLETTYNINKLKKALDIHHFDYDVNTKPTKNIANDVYHFAMTRAEETYALTTVILISLPPLEKITEFERLCEFFNEYVAGETVLLPKMYYRSWM